MKKLIEVALGVAIALTSFATVAGALSVRVKPQTWTEVVTEAAVQMYLDGEIDAGAPRRVTEALQRQQNRSVQVIMNSPGGNLVAGMELGRAIRKSGASTTLGTWTGQKPGECYSACALAFLGGGYRFDEARSSYGVHRVSSTRAPSANDLDTGQVVFAAIADYVREMDVDAGLLSLMASAGADEIYLLDPKQRVDLGVVNGGRRKPQWTIEAVPGGIYLRGVQDTIYGQGKAVILCKDSFASMFSVYEAGSQKAASIAEKSNGWVHSLMLSDETIRVQPTQVEAKDDYVNVMLPLDRTKLLKMASAKSIGHAMQMSYENIWFVGYRVDVDKASVERVKNFLMNCASSQK